MKSNYYYYFYDKPKFILNNKYLFDDISKKIHNFEIKYF